jgi:uncharacterized membrane protein
MTSTTLPTRGAAGAFPPEATPTKARIDSVDVLRGLVIVLMLLDHTRDYVHRTALVFDPTALSRTTEALFLTRWVTHLCAPTFALLTGVGAALQLVRGTPRAAVARFLVSRGFWLIGIEFTAIRFGLTFDLNYAAFAGMLEVMWTLGACMIVLAGFLYLPRVVAAVVGIGIVALHNLTDGVVVQGGAPGGPGPDLLGVVWMVLHQQGFIPLFGAPVLVAYPLLPWIGVVLCGYALGAVYGWESERRRRFLLQLGLALMAAFVVLRAINAYGDPVPWTTQRNALWTLMSFVNTDKYPPSLLFVLMALGPALLILAWRERKPLGRVGRVLVTFGRVPFFFFVVQWFVVHPMGIILSLIAGRPINHLFGMPGATPPAPDAGFGLGVTYLAWLTALAVLYPLCRWFGELKRRRGDWWLSYL